ncbi:hypothetical protein CEXT_664931 [Caerostris extrusa]|uniref:Uncharacterized protein n=1 Tax=Caerostris extrusa TaxID=172846 RepID=A0AAV4RFS1_CAEEX|nr:hypothetical protein CEXT_664931 [Caerostris extrusa]
MKRETTSARNLKGRWDSMGSSLKSQRNEKGEQRSARDTPFSNAEKKCYSKKRSPELQRNVRMVLLLFFYFNPFFRSMNG